MCLFSTILSKIKWKIAERPLLKAQIIGVAPSQFSSFVRSTFTTRNSQTDKWPNEAAKWSGVFPSKFSALKYPISPGYTFSIHFISYSHTCKCSSHMNRSIVLEINIKDVIKILWQSTWGNFESFSSMINWQIEKWPFSAAKWSG